MNAVSNSTAAELGGELEPVTALPVWTGGGIVDVELVERPLCRSPLDADPVTGGYPTVLRGGRVSDLVEVEHLRARIAYSRLRWWRRWSTPRPAGWPR